jgi:4-amino-4-deoxy-L-arabinose transferase-like glycosyltransferase
MSASTVLRVAGIGGLGDFSYPLIPKSPHFFILLIWFALWLRLPALFGNSFHGDEALFASWARLIAVWRDPLLQTQLADKPPLLFYLQALFYPLFGPVEWAARLPNFIASLLLIPLTARFAQRLYGDGLAAVPAALPAAAFVAFSPLAIQFSATAFTDPLLAALLLAALLAAAHGRATWAGIWFGLAVATKYQAWLFLPLLFPLAAGVERPRLALGRGLAGFLPVLVLLLLWQWARAGSLHLWAAQMTSYGGLRLSWSWELWPRLLEWLGLWLWVPGSLLMGLAWLLLAVSLRGATGRPAAWDRLLLLFLLAYFLLHWLLAVPVWDRYLLPVVAPAAVLAGRFVSRLLAQRPIAGPGPQAIGFLATEWRLLSTHFGRVAGTGYGRAVVLLLLFLALAPPALAARDGRYPIGGRPQADGGAAQVAAFLAEAPYGTVLYDHWWSWQWRYHFFDKGVYVSWFPHPAALAEDLVVFGGDGNGRYLALPATAAALPVNRAVNEAGFQLRPAFTATGSDGKATMRLYEIVPSKENGAGIWGLRDEKIP